MAESQKMKKTLHIHLLGPFEVILNGEILTSQDWRSQQTQTIAKIMLSDAGKVVTSDFLSDVLWPNETLESTRSRLHVRICQLRSGLKDKKDLIRTVNEGYIFEVDDSCWVDVKAFQSLLSQGRTYQEMGQQRKAIEVYEEVWNRTSGNSRMARNVSAILSQAGFVDVTAYGSAEFWGTAESTERFGQIMALRLEEADFVQRAANLDIAEEAKLKQLSNSWRRWGNTPNSFSAIIWCEAVGWKK